METNNAQIAIETLAADPTLASSTWNECGIIPIRNPSAAPLPLRDCGIFRCPHPAQNLVGKNE